MSDLISRLSEIRSQYNCFSESEQPYYHALSKAIKVLSGQADGDTVSRQAAIDAVSEGCQEWRGIFRRCKEKLLALPSAQPERQRGRWIEYIPGHGKCPFCGNQVDLLNGKSINFCSECGTDMRGEDI